MSDTAVLSLTEQLAELRLLRREEFIKKAEEIIGSRGSLSAVEADLRTQISQAERTIETLKQELKGAQSAGSRGGDSTVRLSDSNLKLMDQVIGLKLEVQKLEAGKGSGEPKLPADLMEFAALMQAVRGREGMFQARFEEWDCGELDFGDLICYGKDALDNLEVAFNDEDLDSAKLWSARAGLWTLTALSAVKQNLE